MITAIVLAAGNSQRFNNNKMHHQIVVQDNKTIPIALASCLNIQPHVDQTICVVQPNDKYLSTLLTESDIHVVANPNFQNGMASSITHGIKTAPKNSHICLCLGDMPYIQQRTYDKLIQQFKQSHCEAIVRPQYISESHTYGHPVLFPNSFREALLTLDGDQGAKQILKKENVITMTTRDSGVIHDIDQQSDIR